MEDISFENRAGAFYHWFKEWYKPLHSKVNILISIPNEIQPYIVGDILILDLFEKIDQSIDAKIYLQQIIDKAKEFKLTIYLFPSPRHKYITSEEHKNKINMDYVIGYFEKFGFELSENKQFMKL
jgi:hypothetical protein